MVHFRKIADRHRRIAYDGAQAKCEVTMLVFARGFAALTEISNGFDRQAATPKAKLSKSGAALPNNFLIDRLHM